MSVETFIDVARGAVGLSADDVAFQALCGPGEPPERAAGLARDCSTCALFVRGCLWEAARRVGRPPPTRVCAPYKVGMAMADVVDVLASRGADLGHLAPGRVLIVGRGGEEHVLIVETIERHGWPDGSIEYTAIEAGIEDEQGRQCCRRRKHEIDQAGNDRALGTWFGPRLFVLDPKPARPVSWVLDVGPFFKPELE